MEIRKLTDADAEVFWALRLRGLQESPEAFGSSYEDSVIRPLSSVAARLRNEGASPDNFVLGALDEGLIGVVGFARDEGVKVRHKGLIWGVYVAHEARGRGVGKALMRQAVDHASALPGLEQIYLGVGTYNTEARNLYLSLGFQVYGVEPNALKLDDKYIDEEMMVYMTSDE